MRNRITFLDFKSRFNSFQLVSTSDIAKVFPTMHRRRLFEWSKRGLIRRVIKGFYMFSDTVVSEFFLYHVSNRIYEPSYISLQSALSWYGLIPEFVPQITAISSKKTNVLNTDIGSFSYCSVKNSLMFGYDLILSADSSNTFKMAFPEKAVLDLLHINPNIKSLSDFKELRFNKDVFYENIKPEVLKKYLALFGNFALEKRVRSLLEYINNA